MPVEALDLSKLPHYRHELSLIPEEKTCEGCGRARDQIGHDETKISGIRAGEAGSPRLRATQVRLPVL